MLFTRTDYLAGVVDHSTYYGQFVTPYILRMVAETFGPKTLSHDYNLRKDVYFNSIPLRLWDRLALFVQCSAKLREAGDYQTLMSQVCILKEAARQIATSEDYHKLLLAE